VGPGRRHVARRPGGAGTDRRAGRGGRGGSGDGGASAVLGLGEAGVHDPPLGPDLLQRRGGQRLGPAQVAALGREPGRGGPQVGCGGVVAGVELAQPADPAGRGDRVTGPEHRGKAGGGAQVGGDGPVAGPGPEPGHLGGEGADPGLGVVDPSSERIEPVELGEVPPGHRVGLGPQRGHLGLGRRDAGIAGLGAARAPSPAVATVAVAAVAATRIATATRAATAPR